MLGCYPSKNIKPNPESTSSKKKTKLSLSNKTPDRPYLIIPMPRVIYYDNVMVGVCDVHLPDGWLLNVRMVTVPPMPCHGRECHDEIRRHRQAILPWDM
jgi:hypothetical protein